MFKELQNMGQNQSNFHNMPEVVDRTKSSMFTATFCYSSFIKLVNADAQVIELVCSTFDKYAAIATNPEMEGAEAAARKCSVVGKGNSWCKIEVGGMLFRPGTGKGDALKCRHICCQLLKNLGDIGWSLVGTAELSANSVFATYYSTWVFKYNPAVVYRMKVTMSTRHVLAVNVSDKAMNKIHLINADVEQAKRLLTSIDDKHAREKVLREFQFDGADRLPFEVRLSGQKSETIDHNWGQIIRHVLLRIINGFNKIGYHFSGTCNFKGTPDTMFFERSETNTSAISYGMLSLTCKNRLHLINVTNNTAINIVRTIAVRYWREGIIDEKTSAWSLRMYNSWQLILRGSPWRCEGNRAAEVRLLITKILQGLMQNGWTAMGTLNINRDDYDSKSVFILKVCEPQYRPHFALAPEQSNKLRLLNSNKKVADLVVSAITKLAPDAIVAQRPVLGGFEWTLAGAPWLPIAKNDFVLCRYILTEVMQKLAKTGWRMLCAADISNGCTPTRNDQQVYDVHTLFFVWAGRPSSQKTDMITTSRQASKQSTSSPTHKPKLAMHYHTDDEEGENDLAKL